MFSTYVFALIVVVPRYIKTCVRKYCNKPGLGILLFSNKEMCTENCLVLSVQQTIAMGDIGWPDKQPSEYSIGYLALNRRMYRYLRQLKGKSGTDVSSFNVYLVL